jgi:hypothetical protein
MKVISLRCARNDWGVSATILIRRFAAERLTQLVRTLELTNIDEHYALQKVAGFGTLGSRQLTSGTWRQWEGLTHVKWKMGLGTVAFSVS